MTKTEWFALLGLGVNSLFLLPLVLGALRWLLDLRSVQSQHTHEILTIQAWITEHDKVLDRRLEGFVDALKTLAVLAERVEGLKAQIQGLTDRQ